MMPTLILTETLIVWTEANVTDMALSFQEAEGCAVIWWVFQSLSLLVSLETFYNRCFIFLCGDVYDDNNDR
jgi:hypothetical protein